MDTIAKTSVRTESSTGFIIGIGASAGGLEAIYKLLSTPLPEEAAIIIIQHLPPDYKSSIVELLSTHTKKEVIAARNGMSVESGKIYVMNERHRTRLKDGLLFITPLDSDDRSQVIDYFLTSLAEAKGEKAIAVILSGSNNDGTVGASAIKESGGLVIAQDPKTTNFDNMPQSVIKSGAVDIILAPEVMMEEITYYLKQKTIITGFSNNDEEELNEILDIIQKNTPLDFREYKKATLTRRIIKRIVSNKLNTLQEYIAFLKSEPKEIEALSKEFLISVTSFFRDKEAFALLKENIIPEILDADSEDPVKFWCVGCATGEEAYSLAMLVEEHFTETGKRREVKIFATDIDSKALNVGSRGVYPESISKDVSAERLEQFFTHESDGYRIKEHLRQMIIFARHDITKHPPYHKIDLICCRNVLIYMNRELQKRIFSILNFSLKQDGFLFLGPSESIGELTNMFTVEDKRWKIFRNTQPGNGINDRRFIVPPTERQTLFTLPVKTKSAKDSSENLLEKICYDLLKRSGDAVICVDENFNIVKILGDYKKFLLPEMFTFHLPDLLPRELAVAVNTSMRQSIKGKKEVSLNDIAYDHAGTRMAVNIVVHELQAGKAKLLVLFHSKEVNEDMPVKVESYDAGKTSEAYLRDLESELAETREKLAEAKDALVMSVDNAQAYNEELITNNEELQSTNEEVQSINEELQTVNHDYQETIKKLTVANDDLNNYFRSSTNSQLYVDNQLIIRKFSPMSFKQINLKDTDIGRPLSDISTNIKFSTLIADIQETIDTLQKKEKEVQTLDGKWYQLIVTPYQSEQDKKVDGAIITLNDITELKETQAKLKKIIEDHDTFIYSVSHDLKSELGNILLTSEYLNDHASGKEMDRAEITKFSGYVLDSVKNLINIVSDLSDIARIEKEIMSGHHVDVNMEKLLNDIKQSLASMISQSGAVIKTDFQVKEIPFMKKNLRSIVHNLVTNAIKYRLPQRKPVIEISTVDRHDSVMLSVKDNGMGIKNDMKGVIFSKYKRLRGKNNNGAEGEGIGLYLIDKMVRSAGGRIELDSEENKGSTFSVWFPKKIREDNILPAQNAQVSAPQKTSKK